MSEFSVNFGNAKKLELPPEGAYTLKITGYELAELNKVENRDKGFNVKLTFNIDEDSHPSLGGVKVWHNLYVDHENPFAAQAFYSALTGRELDDDSLDISDPDYFMGEKIGAFITHEVYEKKTGVSAVKLTIPSFDAFYTVD